MEITVWDMRTGVFSGKALFIHLSIRIFFRKLHCHTSGRSDDLPSQKYVFQAVCLYLLPEFRSLCKVHLKQQKQVISEHHQLEDRFTRALFFRVLAQNDWSNRCPTAISYLASLMKLSALPRFSRFLRTSCKQ
jgi:hypothetical protein